MTVSNNHRQFMGVLGAACLLLGTVEAFAAERQLRIQRNASGTVVQEFTANVRYDGATQALIADTQFGDRRCGDQGGYTRGDGPRLLLDGVSYPVRPFNFVSGSKRPVTVEPIWKDGVFPLCTSDKEGSSTIRAPGQLELDIQAAVGGTGGRVVVPVQQTAQLNTGADKIQLGLAEDVICMQFDSGTGIGLEFIDTYGVVSDVFQGLSSVVYRPFAGGGSAAQTLVIDTTNSLVCAGLPTQTRGEQGVECVNGGPDRLFANSFGDPVPPPPPDTNPSGVDLQVDFKIEQFPTVPTGSDEPAVYDVTVTNCGLATATNVHLRDLYPRGNAPAPRLEGDLGGSSWTCIGGAVCSPASGQGYIDTVLGNIASGQSLTVRATRALDNSANNQVGQQLDIVAVALSEPDDGEALNNNNSGMWNVPVQLINNLLPVVSLQPSNTSSPILEDSQSVLLTGVSISASDPDGSVTNVTVRSETPDIIADSDISVSGPFNDLQITVSTVADANGTARLLIEATDNEGGVGSGMLNVPVTAVNDPPRFDVLGDFTVDFGSVPPFSFGSECAWPWTTTPDPDFGVDVVPCAQHIWPSGTPKTGMDTNEPWVLNGATGPANEGGTLTYSIAVHPDSTPGLFLGSVGQPKLDGGELEYILAGVSGAAVVEVTANDGEGGTSTLRFRVEVSNTGPAVCGLESTGIDDCQPIEGQSGLWPAPINEDLSNHCDAGAGPFFWSLKTEENLIDNCESNNVGAGPAQLFGVRIYDAEGDAIQSVRAEPVDQFGNPDNSVFSGDLMVTDDLGVYTVAVRDTDIVGDANGSGYFRFVVTDAAGSTTQTDPVAIEVRSVNDEPSFVINTALTCDVVECTWDNVNQILNVQQSSRGSTINDSINALVDTLPIPAGGVDYGAADENGTQDVSTFIVDIPDGNCGDTGIVLETFFMQADGDVFVQYCDDGNGGLVAGSAAVTVQLRDDGGTDHGGDNTSQDLSFTIQVQ